MTPLYKPVGGIAGVSLYRKDDIEAVRAAGGRCVGIDLRTGAAPLTALLVEDRSSYTEESVREEGLPATRHTLKAVFYWYTGREELAGELLEALATDGAVACVELRNGERLVVGWSERLGLEQPLRLTGYRFFSGAKPADLPQLELHLESCDASRALRYEPA